MGSLVQTKTITKLCNPIFCISPTGKVWSGPSTLVSQEKLFTSMTGTKRSYVVLRKRTKLFLIYAKKIKQMKIEFVAILATL